GRPGQTGPRHRRQGARRGGRHLERAVALPAADLAEPLAGAGGAGGAAAGSAGATDGRAVAGAALQLGPREDTDHGAATVVRTEAKSIGPARVQGDADGCRAGGPGAEAVAERRREGGRARRTATGAATASRTDGIGPSRGFKKLSFRCPVW